MKLWNICKNIMLTLSITMLYAIWSKEGLHEVSRFQMWTILIAVGLLVLHLLNMIDREIKKLMKERRKKNEKIVGDTEQTESTKGSIQ